MHVCNPPDNTEVEATIIRLWLELMRGHITRMTLYLYSRVLESDGKCGSWTRALVLSCDTFLPFFCPQTSQAPLFLSVGEQSSPSCQQAWFPNPGQTLA